MGFTGNYGTKGCYGYMSGKYAGHYFFGTGGTESQMSAPVPDTKGAIRAQCNFNTSSTSEAIESCTDSEDCQGSFASGLVPHPSGGNWTAGYYKVYNFTGNYGRKGCYGYMSGKNAGHYFFGTGGTPTQMTSALSGSAFRTDCFRAPTTVIPTTSTTTVPVPTTTADNGDCTSDHDCTTNGERWCGLEGKCTGCQEHCISLFKKKSFYRAYYRNVVDQDLAKTWCSRFGCKDEWGCARRSRGAKEILCYVGYKNCSVCKSYLNA